MDNDSLLRTVISQGKYGERKMGRALGDPVAVDLEVLQELFPLFRRGTDELHVLLGNIYARLPMENILESL